MRVDESLGNQPVGVLQPLGQHQSESIFLDALVKRVEEYRRNPSRPLSAHSFFIDPVLRPHYLAVYKRYWRKGTEWWIEWLMRGGMNREEACRATHGCRYTRAGVLQEIVHLYQESIGKGTWPRREVKLPDFLRARARRTYGSAKAAREAALEKLGLKRTPPKSWAVHRSKRQDVMVAIAPEHGPVAELAKPLSYFLSRTQSSAEASRVSFEGIAWELGLSQKTWTARNKVEYVSQLLLVSVRMGPEVLSRLVRMIVKRAVRYRRLRDGWCWNRAGYLMREPVWREEVDKIIGVLSGADIPLLDLNDEEFLRGLPRRGGFF